MDRYLRVLMVDASSGYYRIKRYQVGDFFGPVDLGLHLAGRYNSLNIGVGLLAGSIFPGSNRLVFTGFSPNWGGFYISSMGGAGLVFDDLGINLLAITGRASTPSILCLNRVHGEEIQLEIRPLDIWRIWDDGGIYNLMQHAYERYGGDYQSAPRILATGPAAAMTDCGAICSVPIDKSGLTHVDTWAGRGGLGSKLYQEHGLAAVIYGGTHIDEDFRDRKVADLWFKEKYDRKLAAKDLESTTKYRFDEKFGTGGTFGVNYATLKGRMLSFNYRSIYMREQDRLDLHQNLVLDHYLKQFNEETIAAKQQKTCGEPCAAVCKKMHGKYKKDYEPYQTMGPLCGIFDQRAAEMLNRRSDMYGFDAINSGGVLAWLLECLYEGLLKPEDLGLSDVPNFEPAGFSAESDSAHNARLGMGILDGIINRAGILDLSEGARKFGRHLARDRGRAVLDPFVYTAFARKGWMVPNQYWTPGALAPMAIMGKYYMYYGNDFLPPRALGHISAERFRQELIMDNMGICRFHRGWAEEMLPEIVEKLLGSRERFLQTISSTASRINSRNASVFWESRRSVDLLHTFLRRGRDVEGETRPELELWLAQFEASPAEAALNFWYEIHKGISESLREL